MIEKQSPEGQFLTVCWRTMLEMAGPISEQYKWLLTGIAGILGVVVANIESLQKAVSGICLKVSICLLIAAVLLAAIAYLLSTMLHARNNVVAKLENVLGTVEARAILSQMKIEPPQLREELCKPFFGPLKFFMRRAAERAAVDQLSAEKGSITLAVWQAYAMWLCLPLTAAALIVLVAGLK